MSKVIPRRFGHILSEKAASVVGGCFCFEDLVHICRHCTYFASGPPYLRRSVGGTIRLSQSHKETSPWNLPPRRRPRMTPNRFASVGFLLFRRGKKEEARGS